MERASTMDTNNQNHQGIHAKRIQADHVVSGVYIQGGDPQQAAALIHLAQGIRRGEISAEEIIAHSVVMGLQYIADPTTATTEDLYRELIALRTRVEQAINAQEFADANDAEDAKDSLKIAETELIKPRPDGNRVIQKLDKANILLTKSAQAAEAAGKLNALVMKLAPIAAVNWQVAQRIFGG